MKPRLIFKHILHSQLTLSRIHFVRYWHWLLIWTQKTKEKSGQEKWRLLSPITFQGLRFSRFCLFLFIMLILPAKFCQIFEQFLQHFTSARVNILICIPWFQKTSSESSFFVKCHEIIKKLYRNFFWSNTTFCFKKSIEKIKLWKSEFENMTGSWILCNWRKLS